jgi:hypothetical protein
VVAGRQVPVKLPYSLDGNSKCDSVGSFAVVTVVDVEGREFHGAPFHLASNRCIVFAFSGACASLSLLK